MLKLSYWSSIVSFETFCKCPQLLTLFIESLVKRLKLMKWPLRECSLKLWSLRREPFEGLWLRGFPLEE